MWVLEPQHAPIQLAEHSGSASKARCPHSSFWRSCCWSPDGGALLAVQDDSALQLFWKLDGMLRAAEAGAGSAAPQSDTIRADSADQLDCSLRIPQSESLYACDWYSHADMSRPETACVAASCRGQPVHLWDAVNGSQRSTYRTYDAADEVATAHSLLCHPDGERLIAGLSGQVVVWALGRPGRDRSTLSLKASGGGQKGIVSSLACPPIGDLLAVGTFNRTIGIYDLRAEGAQSVLAGHSGGITHMLFSRCGNFLYSGARKDESILCWDVRHTGECVYQLQHRHGGSNQRMAFDIEPCGRHLVAGGTDGSVRAYDLQDGSCKGTWPVAADTVAGCSMHPRLAVLATASGHRRFESAGTESDSDTEDARSGAGRAVCNSLALWHVAAAPVPVLVDGAEIDEGAAVADGAAAGGAPEQAGDV